MNILVVEDEYRNFTRLQKLLAQTAPHATVQGPVASVADLAQTLATPHTPPIDLILADIQLTDGLCFEALTQAPTHPPVIFTTAYDEYAINAFRHKGIDYLLKPIDAAELRQALDRATQATAAATTPPDLAGLIKLIESQTPRQYRERILIATPMGYHVLHMDEADYFSLDEGTLLVHTHDTTHAITDLTLDDLEAELDPATFFRANRQCIVSVRAIHRLANHFGGKLMLLLRHHPEARIVISKEKAPQLKRWLNR